MYGVRLLMGTLLVVSAWAGPSYAGTLQDRQDLKQYCAEDAAHVKQATCFAYILGIADLVGGHDVRGFRVCFPENVNLKLIVKTTEEYLDDHPERLHYTADKLVLDALADAFPCAR